MRLLTGVEPVDRSEEVDLLDEELLNERALVARPILYRVTEVAWLLGIGRTNVYDLMNEGRIKSVRIGNRRLIPRVALDQFVNELLEAS